MSLLRNPWVVGALAVVAAVMVTWRVIWPMFTGFRPRRAAPVPAAAPARAAAPQTAKDLSADVKKDVKEKAAQLVRPVKDILGQVTAMVKPAPEVSMNLPVVLSNATHWIRSPRRDPFNNRAGRRSRAEQLLTLKSVWRQSGSELAVINNRVVAEGDSILEFTLEKIATNHVWVIGPDGREALTFKIPSPEIRIALESDEETAPAQ